jgi:putative hydrolase of the HAD superfamily
MLKSAFYDFINIQHSFLMGVVLTVSFVCFDIGYTLLYMQREVTYQQALKDFGLKIPLEDIEREFHLTDKLFMREYPGIFLKPRKVYMPTYLGLMNYRLGLSVDVCALDERWDEIKQNTDPYWLPFDGVREVLDELRRRSIGMGIISNWDWTARDVLTAAGIIDYFDPIVISAEVDCNKPEARIFELTLQKLGLPAHQCLYVGDNYYDDVVGSRKVGMQALVINRFGRLGVEEINDCQVISRLSDLFNHVEFEEQTSHGTQS